MNWEALGAVAELMGAVGVIASLIYLATQIRMNTKAMRAEAHREAINQVRHLGQTLLGNDLVDIFSTGVEDWSALDDTERGRFAVISNELLRSFESVQNQHAMGMLDDDVWEGWLAFYTDYCTSPGVQHYWEHRRDTFPVAFRQLVDSLEPRVSSIRIKQMD